MSNYDIRAAFEAIENELMASMIRNMKKHRAWEDKEGFHWEQWQALQLRALEEYKRQNKNKYGTQFRDINSQIGTILREARAEGGMNQEITIMNAIRNGFRSHRVSRGATAEFFKVNDRKLDALIKATTDDMRKAETAVLRMANDQYRKVIYNAQVYANTGTGTYEKAVDMATKDYLSAGLNCIEYANGARHTIADYADMVIRTASKRAYLQGEGEMRQKWGISTVIMNKRGNPCPKCLPFCGKVLIDDVWSGGSKDGKSTETGIKYPLMSAAIAAGLYHPRCKDSHTTYFEGISTPPDDKYTKEELDGIVEQNRKEARQQYAERQATRFGRLASYSLDSDNKRIYREREKDWKERSNKGRIKDTVMNRTVVESADYRRRIDALAEENTVRKNVWQEMITAIRHRSGTKFEDLIFIDSKTGKVRRSINFEKESTAVPTRSMRKMLKNTDSYTIIAIHNHPGSTVPSWSDIAVANNRKYKYGLVACHDGRIFKYKITGNISEPFYISAVAKLDKAGYNRDSLREFYESVRDAGIEMEVL